MFVNSSPQRVVNNFISAKLYWYEMFSVVLRIFTVSLLSDIIKQGTLHWGLCSIHRHSASVRAFFARSVDGWRSYLYGMRFARVSSSRLPVIDDFCWIHHRSASKAMLSVRSSIHTICSRSWFRFVQYSVLKQLYGKVYGNTIKSHAL